MTFGSQSRLRKDALSKMEEVMAKEHELLSLGGQAAAAAHSLGTPLSTIKIITQDLSKQLENNKEFEKDLELLNSQVERCNQILKRLHDNLEADSTDAVWNYKAHLFSKRGSEKVMQWCDNGQKEQDSLDIFISSLAHWLLAKVVHILHFALHIFRSFKSSVIGLDASKTLS